MRGRLARSDTPKRVSRGDTDRRQAGLLAVSKSENRSFSQHSVGTAHLLQWRWHTTKHSANPRPTGSLECTMESTIVSCRASVIWAQCIFDQSRRSRISKDRTMQITTFTLLLSVCVGSTDDNQPLNDQSDEQAIRQSINSYVRAFNEHDAASVADHWSESAVFIQRHSGARLTGREAIKNSFEQQFSTADSVRLTVTVESIRFVRPDVAIEDGRAVTVDAAGLATESAYSAVHVREGDAWKLESVRETVLPNGEEMDTPLAELAWMVGDWVDANDESTVETSVQWTMNRRFLTANFNVIIPGMDPVAGVQVIGWDPQNETFRSWMFDSDGGYGYGIWTRKGDQWFVDATQTLADGRAASATNIYTYVDGQSYLWQSIGRRVDGEYLPNIDQVAVRRKDTGHESVEAKAQVPLPK